MGSRKKLGREEFQSLMGSCEKFGRENLQLQMDVVALNLLPW